MEEEEGEKHDDDDVACTMVILYIVYCSQWLAGTKAGRSNVKYGERTRAAFVVCSRSIFYVTSTSF